ncbi:Sapep family Mn(2+)-dependent dipeptidase [Geothrix terrae]|uniref:Sapep family Mn(2+)-dependent dipeptidase n=1 Tax=Geothrix terrae TaxID=2922720 RepID=UPI001FAC7E2A|nr:Sapep family Mn(2+)-dependent dipeptidase [Geothrix terrae]
MEQILRTLLILLLPILLVAAPPSKAVHEHYEQSLAPRLIPLLSEIIRFPTVAGAAKAWEDQKTWIMRQAKDLGFSTRDAGKILEVDLPSSTAEPGMAPVIGLLVHGDVQPVGTNWTIPPFEGVVKDGMVLGRGAADDKGPLIQALLAMKALKEAGPIRTSTIRLLIGSDEESANTDITDYLKLNQPPSYSLVLDSNFPVVVGEKAWNEIRVGSTRITVPTKEKPWTIEDLEAGLSPSIVPDRATIRLGCPEGEGPLMDLRRRLEKVRLDPGCRVTFEMGSDPVKAGAFLNITVTGKAAHGGMNLEGGRNALVALARLLAEELPPGGPDDLLAFARVAGSDLYGTGLGLVEADPLWGRCAVNVATLKPDRKGCPTLTINIRVTPKLFGPALEAHLRQVVADFAAPRKASFTVGGSYGDVPLAFDPQAPLIKRLMASYTRITGRSQKPAISGGGTYAKRMPHAIAFGMWFPGTPYPGHDVDEQISVADLHLGTHVLIEALFDLACGVPLKNAFNEGSPHVRPDSPRSSFTH